MARLDGCVALSQATPSRGRISQASLWTALSPRAAEDRSSFVQGDIDRKVVVAAAGEDEMEWTLTNHCLTACHTRSTAHLQNRLAAIPIPTIDPPQGAASPEF